MRSESLATRHVLIMAGNYYVVFQLSNKIPPSSEEYTLTDTLT